MISCPTIVIIFRLGLVWFWF